MMTDDEFYAWSEALVRISSLPSSFFMVRVSIFALAFLSFDLAILYRIRGILRSKMDLQRKMYNQNKIYKNQ